MDDGVGRLLKGITFAHTRAKVGGAAQAVVGLAESRHDAQTLVSRLEALEQLVARKRKA